MNHTEAVEMVNILTNYGYEARHRSNSEDEKWVEILKPNGKVQRVFTSVSSVEKFVSLNQRKYDLKS